jgi:hypothetical protein
VNKCEIVDKLNTDRGELRAIPGIRTYGTIQSPVGFLNKHQIEIKACGLLSRVWFVVQDV